MLMRSTLNFVSLKGKLKKLPGMMWLWRLRQRMLNQSLRRGWRLQREKPPNLFQPYGDTELDRTPQIFSFVRERLAEIAMPRILSFGCSTGEEVFTLRQYFPQAEIAGIDINPRSIALCRKKLDDSGDQHIRFDQAGSVDAEADASFHVVFCMSVLRHSDLGNSHPARCDHLIRFVDFEATVAGLCRCLMPGGYLVIRRSNFRFCDLDSAAGFETVFSRIGAAQDTTPLYGPDDCLLVNDIYNEEIFRKKI